MVRYVFLRLWASFLTLAIVGTLVFSIIHLLPGDPVLVLLGEQGTSSPEVVAKIRKQLRLDLPLGLQYYEWVRGIARLDFGVSLQNGIPVLQELRTRIPRSLELIAASLAIAVALGIPLGVLGARYSNGGLGWLSSLLAILSLSMPSFVTGVILVVTFSLEFRLFPSSGYVAPSEDLVGHLLYAILPSLTLGIGFVGVVIRMTRAGLLEVLGKGYVRTARAKGLPERSVLYHHALTNALIPVVTLIGVRAGNLLGGMVIVESLFNWPGLSSLLVRSCYDRDYPMMQGTLLAIFALFIFISLTIDLCHATLDPRLREG